MGTAEKLVVEVVAAHNLMPKDGQGSSSAYVEVEFEHQRRRTRAKRKDLNPVWNERLVFPLSDPADLPYRALDVGVYNERSPADGHQGRNFLGKVRVPAAGVTAPGEDPVAQLFTLEKRSLFSHIRGEITLRIYRTTADIPTGPSPGGAVVVKAKEHAPQKPQTKTAGTVVPAPQNAAQPPAHSSVPADVKPVVLAAGSGPLGPDPYFVGTPFSGGGAGQDFALKETRPHLGGGGGANRDKSSSTYDLVEQMQYLYVHVVRARDVPSAAEASAEVKLGNYRGVTPSTAGQQWDQVFAFSKDNIQSSVVEIFVKEKDKSEPVGRVAFDLAEVPRRVPPDSTLAPQWYRLEDKKGDKPKGEVMLSVWFGTQADEAFSEAWHSRAAGVHGDGLGSIKSKVYLSPKLWYLRVSVIEAQDLVPGEKGGAAVGRYPEIFAKAQVGNQLMRTRPAPVAANRSPANPVWNEDMMFVVAEPFEDYLIISVEDRVGPNRDEVLGRVMIPVSMIERRLDSKLTVSRWFGLDRGQAGVTPGRFVGRAHLRLCLDGGYHVLDESTMYSSDLRPTARQLWRPQVGVLELGILGASGLMPMKVRDVKGGVGATDAYCVAKYGQKWIRTRTVMDSLSPKWNEQYTWEVFDPCTVITIGVFDNCHVDRVGAAALPGSIRDTRIGKVRIRLSTLETDRVYTHAYPLLVLHPSGVKKMGELHLAVRFSCANTGNMLQSYFLPLLPKMHYVEPLMVRQVENLRYQATNVVAARLGRTEPPLGREVVEYMLDHGSHLWSMRRSKANFFRLVSVLSGPIAAARWVDSMRSWHQPIPSFMFLLTYIMFMLVPQFILPTMCLYMAVVGLFRFRGRPRHPPHMDTRLSQAEGVYADELDEEFDSFPTSRSPELVRMRYDRLRSVAGRVQTVVGDLATQGERFQALLSWRDPRATVLFLVFCLVAAVVLFAVPFNVLLALWGVYVLRPPKFRTRLPSPPMSFFRRLPTKADSML